MSKKGQTKAALKRNSGSTSPASRSKAASAKANTKSAAPRKTNGKKRPPKGRSNKRKTGWLVLLFRWWLVLMVAGCASLAMLMIYLDARLQQKFDGVKWTLPARVYARPLLLYPGLQISQAQLEAELKWTDYRPDNRPDRLGTYQISGSYWSINRRGFDFWDEAESNRQIRFRLNDQRISDLTVNGREEALVRLEPQYLGGIFPTHNEDRELVNLDEVPAALVGALVATEDRDFFDHMGISFRGIARAMVANVRAGRIVQGGSTLSQQLIKNMYLTEERTFLRKAEEALMAILLETHYSKREILQAYLNEVYLGQSGRRAIHGIGLASRFYFGKPANELNLPEIATLVGLIKGASYYNPKKHPRRARARRDLVLELMAQEGVITSAEMRRAKSVAMVTADSLRAGQREYPAFLDMVRQQLRSEYQAADLETEGLKIFTTLNPWLQHALETSAADHLNRLEVRQAGLSGQLETAAVFTSVDGGEVRAILGGRNPRFFGFNRAIKAKRAIGSLAKPVVYLTALESGRYHWGSRLDDSPVRVSGPKGQVWQPKNYDGQSHGTPSMLDALTHSYNQSSARLGMNVGIEAVANTFIQLGLKEKVPAYPSILLGSLELSPLQVASVYQSIAAEGFLMPLRTVEAVTTAEGNTLSSYAIRGNQKFDPQSMQWLRYGLEQVADKGTAKALGKLFRSGRTEGRLAGKTGTSDSQRDAWFAGFDRRYLGVIWVGRDDNRPMPFYGSSAALPIWSDTMRQVTVAPLVAPRGLVWANVDEQGQMIANDCEGTRYPFPPDRIPSQVEECQHGNWWLSDEASDDDPYQALDGNSSETLGDVDQLDPRNRASESDYFDSAGPGSDYSEFDESQPSSDDNSWLRRLFN